LRDERFFVVANRHGMEAEHMVTVREAVPADTRAIAQVHVDSWRTTYQQITIGGVTLDEIGYGWTDTGVLASREH
jgi:hypothetical protein